MKNQNNILIDISLMSIVKVFGSIAVLALLWTIRDIIALFFVVLVMVAALSPIVDKWSKKMNRVIAISIVYILIVGVLALLVTVIVPPVISQIEDLARSLPSYIDNNIGAIGFWKEILKASQESLTSLAGQFAGITNQIYSTTINFFSGLVAAFTVIVLTFYLLLEQHGAKKFILQHLPVENRTQVVSVVQKIGNKIGAWLRGQLLLGVIVGTLSGIGLWILGVPYVATLALWAGFTELVPYIGPILGAIPAILIALFQSPLLGILTLALYVVIQQLEASFLVPKIMQKAVGLSPVIIILAVLVGAKLAGLTGVILSIPVAAGIGVIVTEYSQIKKSLVATEESLKDK